MSLSDSFATLNHRTPSNAFPLPFAFPAKLHVVCIAPPDDPNLVKSKPLYQRLIDLSGSDGSVLIPDNSLSESSIVTLFQKLAEDMYTSFRGVLKCGNLESRIVLSPTPIPYTKVTDFDCQTYVLSEMIEVCGFIPISDIGSPMAVSRHLILPASSNNKENIPFSAEIDLTDDDSTDEGKTPSFCVLLHGALKVENMAALVTLGDNWFGFIYSWADSKKKSNLMLTALMPGSDVVPWLGDLNYLDSPDNLASEQVGSFPVRPTEKRSYSQNGVVWIRQAGLQSDIQKILRHARKLPEKTQQFYKELNRLRKAAMSLGFFDLLTGLAYIFEQECTQLPGSAHPDCALQLTHAAEVLRKTQNKDFKYLDVPRRSSNITCSSSDSSYLERRGSSVILGLPAVPAHKSCGRRRQSSPLPEQYDFYYPIDIRVIQPTPGGSPCGSERALYDNIPATSTAARRAPLASISSCNSSLGADYPDLEMQSLASDSVFHEDECLDTEDEVDPFSTDSETSDENAWCRRDSKGRKRRSSVKKRRVSIPCISENIPVITENKENDYSDLKPSTSNYNPNVEQFRLNVNEFRMSISEHDLNCSEDAPFFKEKSLSVGEASSRFGVGQEQPQSYAPKHAVTLSIRPPYPLPSEKSADSLTLVGSGGGSTVTLPTLPLVERSPSSSTLRKEEGSWSQETLF